MPCDYSTSPLERRATRLSMLGKALLDVWLYIVQFSSKIATTFDG